jgi:hypothetical protein
MQLVRGGLITVAVLALATCGGPQNSGKDRDSTRTDTKPGQVAKVKAGHTENSPPDLLMPAWTAAAVGQRVTFGLNVVDHELDTIIVTLLHKPASASYDPVTLTVDWTPTADDGPLGVFTVRIVERERLSGNERANDHSFSIDVTEAKHPTPVARPLGAVVETLLTIHDDERLAKVNEAWPFAKMLAHSAELFIGAMDGDSAATIVKPTEQAMFDSFLSSLAEIHENPRLDPSSPSFDRAAFGDPTSWKIITVRPRLDKKWQELRVVYWASNAAEPVFAMFRLRPVRTGKLPDGAHEWNNRVFSQMVFDRLFDADGNLRGSFVNDREAHAAAVADLVSDVATYSDNEQDYARSTFIALATEARMGGGTARNADGGYASGDGWAWSAMKPLANADGTAVSYTNIRIKGFWTATKAKPDSTGWTAACAPRFDPHDPGHEPGYEALCRPEGLVDVPAMEGGVVISGKKEASNLYRDHKMQHSVEHLALRDSRRDLGEEKGMTCSQCHMRNFGVRDRSNELAMDPRAVVAPAMNPVQATTFFAIVPTNRWAPYTIEFQKDQECKASAAMERHLGKATSLSCPLNMPLEDRGESDDALRARVIAEFEAAVLDSKDAYLELFDLESVGVFQIILRRHDLNGRWPNIPANYKRSIEMDTGEPYPPERERRTVGNMYKRVAQRAVGTGRCAPSAAEHEWVAKMGQPFEPLPAGNEQYIPLREYINPMIEAGGVLHVGCSGGGHGAAVLYTRTNTPRGYSLLAISNDPLIEE